MTNMTCFRFNMDNPEYAKAWNHLHSVDKNRDKSANYAVVKAINEHGNQFCSICWKSCRGAPMWV